ncbi:hybrid sensor histidine kinase/response regulator [Sinorhizobium mexicanum]|uniref:histidine kinase n=1 Tax=Sinorhizobium mexicanum TaxID=375549 RepID=A0A859QSX6_9HYPH|nr:ATP-binding protein [Sinorhizobium mexicanum]MBP1887852.1 signal transduction histidine kinase/CheY-like chemotaxis protein [Sinorhizobium mexicanum]QLL60368.1 response regulator [Sinorhizobium mexicanum]
MSEASRLQRRIEPGFGTGARAGRAAPLAAAAGGYWPARAALAVAGIAAAVILFAAGAANGLPLISAIIAAGGLAGAFLLLADGIETGGGRRGTLRETASDEDWQWFETSALLSTIHDGLGDLAVVRTMDGQIVYANTVLHEVCARVDVCGLTCAAIGLSFEPKPEPNHYLARISTPRGIRLYDWHDVIAREPATGRLMRHSIARDVTEEARAAREREEARRRAEEASRAKSRLLATVSHEVRTPLSGILGMSHLLGQTRLSAEQKNYLAGMQQSGHALVQLVEDLIDFSSLSAGRFQLRPSQQDLRLVIESVVEMLAHRAHEKGIEIAATVAADVPAGMVFDAARLRQVLFNVIGNAVKFTETGGVLVAADIADGGVRIRIDDTGPGMSGDELGRVFEEFEQAGDDSQRAKGTGLGLAISRRIMEAFGGNLTASSASGHGSRFEVRFPLIGSPSASARDGVLSGAHVLALGPDGPVSNALAATITSLGGVCHRAPTLAAADAIIAAVLSNDLPLTDVIVDHRHSEQFRRLLALRPEIASLKLRRTYLINPEERTAHPVNQIDGYEAWLIRPLRERSLVAVLLGRLKGIEKRDAFNDNRPILREALPPGEAGEQDDHDILLAEDDPVNALILRTILRRAGFRVRHVGDFTSLDRALHDPDEALRKRPRLILTDLNMPGGDGLAMLKRLREQEATGNRRRLPVIVLTSDTRGDLHELLRAAGADSVLAKPPEPGRLTAEIARLLEA